MKLTVLFVLFSVLSKLKAEEELDCHIDGITDPWSPLGIKLDPINDIHEGEIAKFTTKNIEAIRIVENSKNNYLTAGYENGILTIFPSENFKNFEKDRKGSFEAGTSIEIKFDCTNKNSASLTFRQEVIDTNNHLPIFEKTHYEYNFGMAIPIDFELTIFQDIRASDEDFLNDKIYFTTDSDEINNSFKIEKTGRSNSGFYSTTLKALKNIPPPFKQEFMIIATDSGNPPSSTKATVVIRVNLCEHESSENDNHPPVFSKNLYIADYTLENSLNMDEDIVIKYGAKENMMVQQSGYAEYFKITQNSLIKEKFDVLIEQPLSDDILTFNYILIDITVKNEGSQYEGLSALLINLPRNNDNEDNTLHPPVFSKSVYFANYTSDHKLNMEEIITIKYGATNNTTIKQSGYEEFIKVSLNVLNITELKVEVIKPFDNETLENDLIVVEIIAENKGLTIPTRSNLILHLQNDFESSCYNNVHVFGFNIDGSVFPLILFLSAIIMIVFLNVVVLSLYFKMNRARSIA